MKGLENGIQVKKPESIFNRKVSFDARSIFSGITKGVVHLGMAKFDDAGSDAAEILSGLGLDNSNEELAFLLIKRALFSAAHELASENSIRFKSDISEKLSDDLDGLAVFDDIVVDKSFLSNPADQQFLSIFLDVYEKWLIEVGVSHEKAALIKGRFPSYFVHALILEWRNNSKKYAPLIDEMDGPFAGAALREIDWENYKALLKKRTNENVFDEVFGLSQVYVPLNAYYVCGQEEENLLGDSLRKERRIVVDLQGALLSWIGSYNKDDSLRVISGGPGCGKSSFAKIFCEYIASNDLARPIYIPLHLIDPLKDVSEEVVRFLRDEGYLRFNPFDQESQQKDLLLVFDGLDELASQGKAAAQIARDFVRAVEWLVERRAIGSYPIRVLISGRELVVQENQAEFRRPKQILNILPYYIEEFERGMYEDPEKLLENDYRDIWWKNYGAASGGKFDCMPARLKMDDMAEITSQPLLNYLVALSFNRGKLDFNKGLNLNNVYFDLVSAVYERGYENKRTFGPIKHLQLKEFFRVLEEIGLAAWHSGDGRSTSVAEILAHCSESGLGQLIESFQEGARAGVSNLLAAFFFRKTGVHAVGDATFVFTHKSFGEYLTAIRVARGMEKIVTQMERRRADPDDGFDVSDALISWLKLVGKSEMTTYIYKFLYKEIYQKDVEILKVWHRCFSELFGYVARRGIPVEKAESKSFYEASRLHVNASSSLLIALNLCAQSAGLVTKVEFQSENSFGNFLRKNCPQRVGPQSPLLYRCLSYMDLSGQCLDLADLYDADLSNCVMNGIKMNLTHLSFANLMDSDLTNGRLGGADLSGAKLNRAIFVDAHLFDCDFKRAIASEANFFKANLARSDLSQTDLSGANFSDSNLELIVTNDVNKRLANEFRGAKQVTVDKEVPSENVPR